MHTHLQEIQHIIDREIGPAGTLGFAVDNYSGQSLTLTAPLERNLNHHGTAFGGSLFALAAVCGWGFVLLKLREANLHGLIVVKHSSVDYLAPVTGDLSVSCGAEPATVKAFIDIFRDQGRARLTLDGVAPALSAEPALRLQSTYTVIAKNP
ncbi:MAG: YiiD C-terminal domain-containing protein [Granulosicoccaceae bacterium]